MSRDTFETRLMVLSEKLNHTAAVLVHVCQRCRWWRQKTNINVANGSGCTEIVEKRSVVTHGILNTFGKGFFLKPSTLDNVRPAINFTHEEKDS